VNARAAGLWSAVCLTIVFSTTNPIYRALVLGAALAVVLAGAGLARARPLLVLSAVGAALATVFNLLVAHVGATVLFELPDAVPAVGGPYTLEALAFGLSTGVTLTAAIVAVSPLWLLLQPEDLVDALPAALSRTGGAIAASLNLVPGVAASFAAVTEAQRLRGWRPRGPRSWAEVVVPVVLTTIEGSIQLAESMEARGYGSGPRTHVRPPRLQRGDWVVAASSALALLLFLISRATGAAADWYPYPSLTLPDVSALPVGACLLLLTPLFVWPWRRSTG
jgi:energy-coupling factor transport system permease protein